jgi:hypothetical protein
VMVISGRDQPCDHDDLTPYETGRRARHDEYPASPTSQYMLPLSVALICTALDCGLRVSLSYVAALTDIKSDGSE